MELIIVCVVVEFIALISCCIAGYYKIKKLAESNKNILADTSAMTTKLNLLEKENSSLNGTLTSLKEELQVLRGQIFIREGILIQEKGKWCLEFDGAKKYFTPGKIENVESGDYTSEFIHSEETITSIVRQNGVVVSEIVYKSNGSPLSGKVYQDGVAIKQFEYDEFGQVSKEENL